MPKRKTLTLHDPGAVSSAPESTKPLAAALDGFSPNAALACKDHTAQNHPCAPLILLSASVLTIAITTLLPWVSYALCRQLSVDGFLPRYTLHWFCPEHLLLLAVWRVMQGDLPSEVPAI